jgi:tetratricopeptide (TPR) repeat protein
LGDFEGNPSNSMKILAIGDLNKNGLPEIAVRTLSCLMNGCAYLFIAEWDGTKFAGLIRKGYVDQTISYAEMCFYKDPYLKDLDNDGIPELVGIDGPGDDREPGGLPWRLETHIYKWDGKYYTAQLVEYSEPVYLFQAVQDGDHFALNGQFEKALKSYRNAIQNENLGWWSEERHDYLLFAHKIGPCIEKNAHCPPPEIDFREKPILQAYSYYRIMLTQLMLGQPDPAENTYKKLTGDYKDGDDGDVIAKMAAAFWQEYQASGKMGNACAKAIAYAANHESFLPYIGSDYNGSQMQKYKPEDICPFK